MNIKLINFDNKRNNVTSDFLNLHYLKKLIHKSEADNNLNLLVVAYYIFENVFGQLYNQTDNKAIQDKLKREISFALEAGFSDPIEITS